MSLMVSVSGVRGIVGPEFHPDLVAGWAEALHTILGPGPIVLGRDSRPSGDAFLAVASGRLQSLGRTVFRIGVVPTPTVQLAVEQWGAAGGLILSASHNPPAWNALKFVDGDGSFLSPERFALLREAEHHAKREYPAAATYAPSYERHEESLDLHLRTALSLVDSESIRKAGLRVTLETGHGAGGPLLSRLAAALRVELDGRHLEPTGELPKNPEPTAETLERILDSVDPRASFLGMVDPDADRFGLALPGTEVVGEEWTLPLAVCSRLESERGPLVTNLSTSTRLDVLAERFAVPLHRTPVGEAHVVAEMRRRSALIGGEGNGGVIDPRAHLGRDSAVAFALLCQAEATTPGGLRALAQGFPARIMIKDKLALSENSMKGAESALASVLGPPEDERDGLRWGRPDGFVHVRASNTEPILRLVVETGSEAQSRRLAGELRAAVERRN